MCDDHSLNTIYFNDVNYCYKKEFKNKRRCCSNGKIHMRNVLYKNMEYYPAILLGLLYVQVSCQDNIDVINAFRQACPYNNFCLQNASQTLQDGHQAPCCKDCSCDDDCWKRDNCCPDKIVKEERKTTELESCKDTYVKKSIYNVYTPNGYDVRKRYFVIESCPGRENDDILKQKCTGTLAETFTDLTWVSDMKTNKIYNNKFCAECNGVRKYKNWGLSTSCLSILWIQNYSQNVGSFPDVCSLVVTPPNRKAYENQCLTPDISTCNETGLWRTKDSVIESLCTNHPMMFVKEHFSTAHIYRNVFCSLCNSSPGAPEEDICENKEKGQRSGPSAFTAILNIFEADDNLETKNKCNVDEVEDPLRVTDFMSINYDWLYSIFVQGRATYFL